MTTYERFPLQRGADAYIASVLGSGTTLASLLGESGMIPKGEVGTVLPSDTAESELYKFEVGGTVRSAKVSAGKTETSEEPTPIRDLRALVAGEIARVVSTIPHHVCVMENPLARPSDPATLRYVSDTVTFGHEIYHVIGTHPTISVTEEQVAIAIREAGSAYRFVAALVELPKHLATNGLPRHLDMTTLEELAQNCHVLYLGAYDGEAYLRWARADLAEQCAELG